MTDLLKPGDRIFFLMWGKRRPIPATVDHVLNFSFSATRRIFRFLPWPLLLESPLYFHHEGITWKRLPCER